MILLSIGLIIVGLLLSAFFSGSETGFYRASRVRMVIASLEGDRIAANLLRLVNNPALFVATTLIGNNVANYLTSLAIVLLIQALAGSALLEMVAPVLLSPFLFVYGELLPKNLFFYAPDRLLRLVAPMFIVFTILFAPAVALLWLLSRGLEKMLGQSPNRVQLRLARKELAQVFDEGMEMGLLQPAQRLLGQHFSIVATTPVSSICTPINRVRSLPAGSRYRDVLKLAQRKQVADIPVYDGSRTRFKGFVRTLDALTVDDPNRSIHALRPLPDVAGTSLVGEALLHMHSERLTLARVVNRQGKTIGLLSIDQLINPVMQGQLRSLKR